ncbi:MAG: hypothetical protein F6K16_23225 [Symploca sp. SIO2B6]|nr:hypothetical protein [Symploca sp. SIO2B6]
MDSNQGTQKVKECKHNPGDVWPDECCGQDAEAKSSSEELIEHLEEQNSKNGKIVPKTKMTHTPSEQNGVPTL